MAGRTGLRYSDVLATLDRYLPHWQQQHPAVWDDRTVIDLLQDVQIIEAALLAAWRERSDEQQRNANGPHH